MCVCRYVCVYVCVCVCVCVCVSSLQYFDMIKDKKYGLFKTYFYSYNTWHAFPTDNLLIVRPLKVLPCYLKVASGLHKLSSQRHLNAQHCPDMFHTDVMNLRL